MKNDRRSILKRLLLGKITGHQAAEELKRDGKTVIHLVIEHGDGTYTFDDERGLTEELYQAKLKEVDPYGLMETIIVGGHSKERQDA